MRNTFLRATLLLLCIGTLNLTNPATADGPALSPEVQNAIEQITAFNGQYTLTPENTIRTIVFTNGSGLNPEMFDLFARQSDLDTLQIRDYRDLTDETVAKLAGLNKMRVLALTNSRITDATVRMIAESFPNLVDLDIASNTSLTDAAMREIAKLQNLERLSLLFCDFSEFAMQHLIALPRLRALDIRGNMMIGDGGMDALAMMPALRSIRHRSLTVSDRGIRSLIDARALDNLEIQDMQITGQSGQHIRQMERLTSLIIFRCENFDSAGVLALGGLKLNRLTLRGLPINDSAMEVFKELPTVRRLYLQELSSVTDTGMANIANLKELEILDIWEVLITDRSMEVIGKLENLKTLMLRGTNVTDAGLEVLLSMPSLESVTLTDNSSVTSAMIQRLRDAEKFEVLPRQ
ncbi:MAG: hypothetical protein FWG73_05970 [Planctomycetaceae bacterium]|nr:hypothetical protein [Planctomycetaceae bacterium]